MEKEKMREKENSFNSFNKLKLLESLRKIIWEEVGGQIILCQ